MNILVALILLPTGAQWWPCPSGHLPLDAGMSRARGGSRGWRTRRTCTRLVIAATPCNCDATKMGEQVSHGRRGKLLLCNWYKCGKTPPFSSGVGYRPQAPFSNAGKKKKKKARIWNANLIESQDGWLGRFIWVKTHPKGAGNRTIEQEQSCGDESCPEEARVPWVHTGSPPRYWGFGSRTPQ